MKNLFFLLVFLISNTFLFAQLPETFDLRDYNGNNYVTSVKSQQGGTCWTFGTMAGMESNLLMTGEWAAAGETGEPALAEYHLDWWNGFNQNYNADVNPTSGQGLEVHQGGDYRVSTAYMSRGDGAVRDVDGQSYSSPSDYHNPDFHIYYPMSVEWYTAGENLENIDLIKTKVMEYGVMPTCICYSGSYINGEYEHYQPVSSDEEPNHSVSIIGWDDNRVVQGAPGNGAWLTKNSWGSGWGIGGYFWISYYDKQACQNPEMGAVSFIDVIPMPYNNVYYHDYHGWRDTLTFASEAFNKFIAESGETLGAVSFFVAENNVDYTIKIYDNFNGTELQDELSIQTGNIEYSGLHTINLTTPVSLIEGNDFYVYVEFSAGGFAYDRTSDIPVLLGGGSRTIVISSSNPDESYYMDEGVWTDFYDYDDPSGFQNTGNFCIKALTVTVYSIELGNIEITDPTGNNNGRIDPGETVDINISLLNAGVYEVTDLIVDYTTTDPYTTVNSGSLNYSDIPAGETAEADMNISVDGNTPIGHVIVGVLTVECESNGETYNYEFDITFKVGLNVEDFESGGFSEFDWEFGGDADWTISQTNPYEGIYCAKSGAIGNNQESELLISLEVLNNDEIGFYYKVSSEATYDFLKFYIDDVEMGGWSGDVGWTYASYDVSVGQHTFKWAYDKDQGVTGGSDCAWVDWIELPIVEQGSVLPAVFDLRDYDGNNYVTSVKSQQGGTCWTHGTIAGMESNLLMTGEWAAAGETGEPALAEYHLDWWNGFNQHYNADINPTSGQGLEVHMGGDYRVATAYMSRGDGAVRDVDGQSYNSPPDYHNPDFHIYYPMSVEWYTAGANLENIDLIKTKVMEYGVMPTCICYSGSFINSEFEHYQPVSSDEEPNHSVSIIGWDDNKVVQGAPGNGAWLTKNSWGSGWGIDGYFWISYYDKQACQNPEMGAVSFIEVIPMPYNNVYYHDYHGWRDTLTSASKAFNKFIAKSVDTLEAVSFFVAENNVDFTAKIYDDFDGTTLQNQLADVIGNIEYSGLHTINLPSHVIMAEGDDFYVYVEFSDGGIAYDRTSDIPVLLGGGSRTIVISSSNPDESYYMDEGVWTDFYDYDDPSGFQNTGNFCIKVLSNGDTGVGIDSDYESNTGNNLGSYPNPFTNQTKLTFNASVSSMAHLRITNVMGQVVWSKEVNVNAGENIVTWDGISNKGNDVQSGLYIVELFISNELQATTKLLKSK